MPNIIDRQGIIPWTIASLTIPLGNRTTSFATTINKILYQASELPPYNAIDMIAVPGESASCTPRIGIVGIQRASRGGTVDNEKGHHLIKIS